MSSQGHGKFLEQNVATKNNNIPGVMAGKAVNGFIGSGLGKQAATAAASYMGVTQTDQAHTKAVQTEISYI